MIYGLVHYRPRRDTSVESGGTKKGIVKWKLCGWRLKHAKVTLTLTERNWLPVT
jgi:hypothetical protein